MVYEKNTANGLYIGTDLGVYYKNDSLSDWIDFNAGLPNVVVNELEIQYSAKKLRAATYGRGLWESDLYTNGPVAPVAQFTSDVNLTCTGTVKFTDLSDFNPTSWLWEFGDGNTSSQQNPTHTYSAAGTYTVKLTATNTAGNDQETKTSYITVDIANPPSVQHDQRCGPGTVNLGATGSGTLNWYDASTGGSLVNSGNTYSPNLSATTTYYVENTSNGTVQKTGEADSSLGNGSFFTANSERRMYFDVLAPVKIKSVFTYANSAGVRTIEVMDASNNVVKTVNVSIPAGAGRVTLDFDLPAGTGYAIKVAGSLVDLYRNSGGGTSYPYNVAGLISITGTDASSAPLDYYYFFYDWEVQKLGCSSSRVAVTGTINSNPAKPAITQTLNTLSAPSGFTSYQWYLNGTLIPGATGKDYAATQDGNYTVEITDASGCTNTSDIYPFTVTGMETPVATKLRIVPNPVQDETTVHILPSEEDVILRITNIHGQLIYEEVLSGSKFITRKINLGTQPQGIYFLEVIAGKQVTTAKIIRQ